MHRYDLRARGTSATNSRTIQSLGKKCTTGKEESGNENFSCEGTKSVATEKDNVRDCEPLSCVISTSTSLTQDKEICEFATTRTCLHCPTLKTDSSSSNSCHSYQEASPDGKKRCPKEWPVKGPVFVGSSDIIRVSGAADSSLAAKRENASCNGQTTDVSSIDLNEDIRGDETDYHHPHRALVSRPATSSSAMSGISVSSCLFNTGEETRGWRGSAPTSAFKKYKRSKPSSIKGINLNLNLNLPIDFDLNRASESNDNAVSDDLAPPFPENSRKRAFPLYFPNTSSFPAPAPAPAPAPLPSPGFRGLCVPQTTSLGGPAFPGAFRGPGGDEVAIRPGLDLISRYNHQSGSLMEEQMRCFQQSAMSVSAFKRRELLGVRQVNVNPWR